MKKLLLFLALCSACTNPLFAQDDAAPGMRDKKINHQVGVQANELIRQVFNFNNSTSAVNNPYLLTYSLNFNSGWGFRTGVGYNKRTILDDEPAGSVETNLDELRARLGFEKAFRLSSKWSTGVGLDVTYNNNNNKTKSVVNSFDSSTTITKSLSTSYGGGPMGWLRYNISERVLIGTEASVYYATGFDKRTTTITHREFNPSPGPFPTPVPETETITSHTDNKLSDVSINLPVAIYLIVKF